MELGPGPLQRFPHSLQANQPLDCGDISIYPPNPWKTRLFFKHGIITPNPRRSNNRNNSCTRLSLPRSVARHQFILNRRALRAERDKEGRLNQGGIGR